MSKEKVVFTKREQTRRMTILAMFIALIVVMGMVPFLGFIPIFGLSFQIITIPVIIGAVILGRKSGVLLATVFGVVSLIRGAMSGGFDFLFVLPWISILPRVLWGLIIVDVFALFKKLIPQRIIALGLGFFVVTAIHSLFVLPMIITGFPLVFEVPSLYNGILSADSGQGVVDFIESTQAFRDMMNWILGVLITNSVGEAVLGMLVGAVVTDRLLAYLEHNNQAILRGGVYEDSH